MRSSLSLGRNGEIELLRFLFAFIIMLSHYGAMYKFSFFSRGAIGVEYFFLVSGFLMAHSAKKITLTGNTASIGCRTWHFLKKKIAAFYPYYIVALALTFIRLILHSGCNMQNLLQIIMAIPQYLLLEMSGAITDTAVAISGRWYLSAMILAMAVLYPILLRLDNCGRRILFSLIGFLGLGYLQQNYGGIMVNYVWGGFVGLGLIRGAAEISLGVVCYEAAQWISSIEFTMLGKVSLTAIKIGCYLSVFLYGNNALQIEPLIIVFLLMGGIIISFSKVGWNVPDSGGGGRFAHF